MNNARAFELRVSDAVAGLRGQPFWRARLIFIDTFQGELKNGSYQLADAVYDPDHDRAIFVVGNDEMTISIEQGLGKRKVK